MPSSGLLVQPDQESVLSQPELYRQLMQMAGRDLGLSDWGTAISHTSYADDTTFAHTLENQGTGGHLAVPDRFLVEDAAVTTQIAALMQSTLGVTGAGTFQSTLGVSGAGTFSSTLHVSGAGTFDSTLHAAGATTLGSTLGVTGATTLSSTLGVTGATTLSSTLGVTGAATLSNTLHVVGAATLDSTLAVTGATTLTGALLANGAVTLGDAAADAITVTGTATVAEILTLTKGLVVDTTTLVVDAIDHKVGVGAVPTSTSEMLGVAGTFRVTNDVGFPTTGAGVEVAYATGSGIGTIANYSRSGSAYQPLNLAGLTVTLQGNGTDTIQVDGTGVGYFGHATAGQPTAAAAATDLPTVIALANSLRTGLRANGSFS